MPLACLIRPQGWRGRKEQIIQPFEASSQDTSSHSQPSSYEKLKRRFGDRTVALTGTILLELLLIAMLLSIGLYEPEEEVEIAPSLTTFDASDASAEPEGEPEEQAEQSEQQEAVEVEVQPPVTPPRPSPLDIVPIPRPAITPPPIEVPPPQIVETPQVAPPDDRPRAVIRSDRNFGPANSGGNRGKSDTQIVGTAPDGSPLYAARWFREPTRQEMSGYLDTVEPPAWALIACKTAPRWEVVDCVPLDQSSPNSNIMNAVLASTWQYQVRPPVRGTQSLVGSWVRIRISYTRGGPRASY